MVLIFAGIIIVGLIAGAIVMGVHEDEEKDKKN